jgi:heme exporter protein C
MTTTAERAPASASPERRWITAFGLVAIAILIAAQAYAVTTSPPDRDMGNLQKIMYVHVPVAWNAFIAIFVVLVASIRVLWDGSRKADFLAASAAEAGAVLTALTLVLGSLWGRPTWGVWWTWDPRLTSTLVLLLIFIGYLALRGFVDEPERRARWCAAVGILGALNVPVVYMSVRWWRTLHQLQSSPSTVDPEYALGLRINALAVLLVLIYFIVRRYEAARMEFDAEELAERRALTGRNEYV